MRTPPRWLPLAILLALFAGFVALGGLDLVSLERLAAEYTSLRARVDADRPAALALFVGAYVALMSLVVFPASFVLSIAAGVLFGPVTGALAALVGVTTGGSIGFAATRYAVAHHLTRRLSGRAARLRDGVARDGLMYLILLRVTPVFPFWLVTLAAAAAGLRLRQFALGTLIGGAPACFIFAGLGGSAAATLARGDALSPGAMATDPALLAPLAGLALLSALGMGLRRAVRRRG